VIRFVLLLLVCAPAFACDYPDEGNMPLRRAVTRVKELPETLAWAKAMHESGAVVQYALLLEKDILEGRRCYWTLEVNAEGKTWRRFYVTPDGKRLLKADARRAGEARR
jgi:hypothetical protein